MMTMLAGDGQEVVMMMAAVGGVIAVVAIVTSSIEKIKISKNQEDSRREIAAYIAEGSISAEDGRKLMEAGGSFTDAVKNAVKNKLS